MTEEKSRFQTPITIAEAIAAIHSRRYLLPAIQREFIWDTTQITKLFDSLMQSYPISSFLFWAADKDTTKKFQFYEFIREYHERDKTHNPKANLSGQDDITVVLDGQQRLTALYIGLKGSYAEKLPRMRWDNNEAFPKQELYLNLCSKSQTPDVTYDFRFLDKDDFRFLKQPKSDWFKVAEILNFQGIGDVGRYLSKNNLQSNKFAEETLSQLFQVIKNDQTINYYKETVQDIDKVVTIFIRVNSGGTPLSHSDLLLSLATAQWDRLDAREEINSLVDELNKIGDGFNLDKDLILKSCLVLSGIPDISFRVENFRRESTKKIESSWEKIKSSLKLSVELVASYGYNRDTLTSKSALIPIANYLFAKNNPDTFVQSSHFFSDRSAIKKWLAVSLLKRVFSGQPDTVLRKTRELLDNSSSKDYPIEAIVEAFKGSNKSIVFSEDDIELLLTYKYGDAYTFSALSFLYPTLDFRNRFHIDHIHPQSSFKLKKMQDMNIADDKKQFYLDHFDELPNLQLLEGQINREKSKKPFREWLNETCPTEEEQKDFLKKHYISKEVQIDFENFEEFFKKRKELLRQKYKELLC